MIQLSAVGKHFGSKTLFEGLNWVVGNNERVGLVGANGTGKSTLLKMLAGIKGPESQKVADRYHKIETKFQQHDGYRLEAQVGEVLNGLGFSRADQDRRTEEFSGGWQMRIALAKLLLTKPNMLLLDE